MVEDGVKVLRHYFAELEAGQSILAELSRRLELPGSLEIPWPPLDLLPLILANLRNVDKLRATCQQAVDKNEQERATPDY